MPSTEAESKAYPLHVAVAVIIGDDDRILITRRADHLHQGGKWEFPGGKVEDGETIEQALHRELKEELDITPRSLSPLIRIPWTYPDREVLLDVWSVEGFEGTPRAMEAQPMSWVTMDALADHEFPAANHAIIQALSLPDRLLITPEPDDHERFLETLERVMAHGEVKLVHFRARQLEGSEYGQLAKRVAEIVHGYGGRLMIYALMDEVMAFGDGVHFSSRELMSLTQRPSGIERVSASCHNEAEIEQANRLGLDFILLSPVLPTKTHPDSEPLGWSRFEALVAQASMPVYALGGMEPSELPRALSHGAQGIAAIRCLWPEPVA